MQKYNTVTLSLSPKKTVALNMPVMADSHELIVVVIDSLIFQFL